MIKYLLYIWIVGHPINGPMEFSTQEDCMMAESTIAGYISAPRRILCTDQDGQVVSENWNQGEGIEGKFPTNEHLRESEKVKSEEEVFAEIARRLGEIYFIISPKPAENNEE